MPPEMRGWAGAECVGLRTRGDGACGVHAIFGRPRGDGSLACGASVRDAVAALVDTYMARVAENAAFVISRWYKHVE